MSTLDANPNYDSTPIFQQVNRAYEILSDPKLKARYDQYGIASVGTGDATTSSIPVDGSFGTTTDPWQQRTVPFQYDNFVPDEQWRDGGGVTDGADSRAANSFFANAQNGMNSNMGDPMMQQQPQRGGSSFSGSPSFGGSFGGGSSYNKEYMGDDLQLDLDIDLETAVLGGTESILIDHLETCDICQGKGYRAPQASRQCMTCGGAGFVMDLRQTSYGSLQSSRPCPTCGGGPTRVGSTENVIPCRSCQGYGSLTKSKQVDVQIPPGVESYTRLRIRGQGNAGVRGGPAGDLFLFLHVRPHEWFVREGASIRSNVTIDYLDALLGATMETPVISGDFATFEIPPGTQDGDDIVLEGYGGKSLIGEPGARGKHIVTTQIAIPEELDEQEEALLKKLAELQEERLKYPEKYEPRPVEREQPSETFVEEVVNESRQADGTIRVEKFVKTYVAGEKNAPPAISEEENLNGSIPDFEEEYRIEEAVEESPIENGHSKHANPQGTPYYVGEHGNSDFGQLRDLLNTPSRKEQRAEEEAARRKREIQEAEDLVAEELDKLKELLYAPIASTAKATKMKADKQRRIQEAEELVSNEMTKLQELLNAPLESTAKAKQVKLEKQQRLDEANQVVQQELDKLRDLLYSPMASTARMTNVNSEGFQNSGPIGGASSTFVSQESPASSNGANGKTCSPQYSGTGETNGVNSGSAFTSFGVSSQPSQSVVSKTSSSSGVGESVSIAAELVVEPDLHDVQKGGPRNDISSEGIQTITSNSFKGKSDDDRPQGPQVASQALSSSVAVKKPTVVSDKTSIPRSSNSTRVSTRSKKYPNGRNHSQKGSSTRPTSTVVANITERSIWEADSNATAVEGRIPAPARRAKHGSLGSESGSHQGESDENFDSTMRRRRGDDKDENGGSVYPRDRNQFEEGLFNIFKV